MILLIDFRIWTYWLIDWLALLSGDWKFENQQNQKKAEQTNNCYDKTNMAVAAVISLVTFVTIFWMLLSPILNYFNVYAL